MAGYFLKDDNDHHNEKDGWIMNKYLYAVRWCLAHKKKTLLMSTAFFGLSLFLASKLPSGFIPSTDLGYTNLSIELPPGSTLEDTLATAETVRKSVESIEGIENIFAVVGAAEGGGGPGESSAGAVRKGSLILTFLPKGKRPPQNVIDREIRKVLPEIPGARFTLKNDGPGENFSILLSSDNMGALTQTAAALEKELRGLKSISNVNSTASLQRPEINIRPDFARAAELGITTEAIADTVRIATSGDFDPRLSKLNLDNRQLYVRVQMADSSLQDIDTISNLRIPGRSGQTVLSNIASVTTSTGPSQIDRHDRERYVTLSADLGGTALGQALNEAMELPAIKNKPSSVKLLEMGDAEFMGELFSGFGIAMLTGIICVFCVLVLLFKDFFQPVTILSALPLSFGGSIIALLMVGAQMSLPALIGIIMLMGIVTKNSILLVEYTIIGMKERGLSRFDAVINACHKRARPIVMTTVSTIAGMTPIAIGLGGDASFRQPMAIAVIGGLITSTFLSLLVVPVIFTYLNMAQLWFARRVKSIHLIPDNPVLR
jgi:multidrug efflux pump subunit AcrB